MRSTTVSLLLAFRVNAGGARQDGLISGPDETSAIS